MLPVLLGLYSDAFGPGSDKLEALRVDLSPTEYFEHDGQGNATLQLATSFTLKVGGTSIEADGQRITLKAGGGTAVLDSKGLTGTPDVFADTISGKTHVHDKVAVGKANSGKPQP